MATLRRLIARYPANPRVALLRHALTESVPAVLPVAVRQVVAVQSVEDPLYFALFSAIVAELGQSGAVHGELVVVRAISGAIGVNWRARLMRSQPMTWIFSTQWLRAYRGLIEGLAYRSLSLAHPVGDLVDWFRSVALWLRVRRHTGAFPLNIRGVPVGDLITDSYLRFRPSPRFDAADPFVVQLIWQAHRDVRRAQAYFRGSKPSLYLTSYSTYLEHGIPVRVALQEGVVVQSFGNLVQFGKRLSLSDWFHTPNCEKYRAVFESLDNQVEKLAQAEGFLQIRLSGGIDPATSYMRVSAYANVTDRVPPGVAGAVVVFLHDFFDSPHVYDDLVFDDFWAWICFTIQTLQRAGVPFYLKPHPNQISLSSAVLQELQTAYPGVQMLPEGITNAQLAAAGMVCGVTVYGTVAHELAYLGVPSIACARHPHNAFDFCRTARTAEQFAAYLQTPSVQPINRDAMRQQALAFYYMHNLYGESGHLALRTDFVAFWKACQSADIEADVLLSTFNALRHSQPFKAYVKQLL